MNAQQYIDKPAMMSDSRPSFAAQHAKVEPLPSVLKIVCVLGTFVAVCVALICMDVAVQRLVFATCCDMP